MICFVSAHKSRQAIALLHRGRSMTIKTFRYTLACALACAPVAAQSPTPEMSRPLGAEAYSAISTFYNYDASIPLNVRIVDSLKTTAYRRYKLVLTGADGERVPGYLAFPATMTTRAPVVLLLHAGAGSKD